MMGILASLGIGFITDMVKSHGEDLVKSGIEKVTGIDLSKKPTEEEQRVIVAKMESIQAEVKMMYADKSNAREMAVRLGESANASWLVKNTGSIIALMVICGVFVLFILLIMGTLSIENSSVAMIVGFAGGYVTQVLSFFFGSSKTEADRSR